MGGGTGTRVRYERTLRVCSAGGGGWRERTMPSKDRTSGGAGCGTSGGDRGGWCCFYWYSGTVGCRGASIRGLCCKQYQWRTDIQPAVRRLGCSREEDIIAGCLYYRRRPGHNISSQIESWFVRGFGSYFTGRFIVLCVKVWIWISSFSFSLRLHFLFLLFSLPFNLWQFVLFSAELGVFQSAVHFFLGNSRSIAACSQCNRYWLINPSAHLLHNNDNSGQFYWHLVKYSFTEVCSSNPSFFHLYKYIQFLPPKAPVLFTFQNSM